MFDSVYDQLAQLARRANHKDRVTERISSTMLRAHLLDRDLANAGVARLRVFTRRDGGNLESGPMEFTITPNRPAPVITRLEPGAGIVGGAPLKLSVRGRNFTPQSTVRWNGVERATGFVSSVELTFAPANGSGKSLIRYRATGNETGRERTGTLTIGGQKLMIRQLAGGSVVSAANFIGLVAPGSIKSTLNCREV